MRPTLSRSTLTNDGTTVGRADGTRDGPSVGACDGTLVGNSDGICQEPGIVQQAGQRTEDRPCPTTLVSGSSLYSPSFGGIHPTRAMCLSSPDSGTDYSLVPEPPGPFLTTVGRCEGASVGSRLGCRVGTCSFLTYHMCLLYPRNTQIMGLMTFDTYQGRDVCGKF
jgi:hypothetical protein